jgi:CMP-N,N'-diacetyllegionaminic acid synthase
MKILCVVSARGGSQGVPGKNVRPMLGRPLIARAVDCALAAPEIDEVHISTDSPTIADAARAAGAKISFMRPAELAQSDTGKFQVWKHALATCEALRGLRYDLYVDLDCTNPLIEPTDISGAITQYRSLRESGRAVDAVFTVAAARRNPYFNLVEPDGEGALRMSKTAGPTVLSRQKAPPVFEHVAGVYVLDAEYVRRAGHLLEGRAFGYEVPDTKAMDVDNELDFEVIEFLLRRRIEGVKRG